MPAPRTKPSASRSDRAAARAKADAAHDKYVQRQYSLAPGQYAEMLAAQDGRCAICRRVPRRRRLAVDHDHQTGLPRALLCYLCNKYLGQWENDPIAAYNAAVYLMAIHEEHERGPEAPEARASVPSDQPHGGLVEGTRQLRRVVLPPLRGAEGQARREA